jgi:hypothetical protein
MDLVDNDRLDRAQCRSPARAGDEEVQRLRRSDHEIGWLARQRRALRGRRVASAHGDGELRCDETELAGNVRDLLQWSVQVLRDVDRERLERRHVDDLRPPSDLLACVVSAIETVDADEESRQRFPRAGGRRDERVRP